MTTLREYPSLHALPAADWDALSGGQPWVSHALLSALEDSGAVSAATGWQPAHLALWEGGQLRGAVPRYLKTHSRGEYVFDWGWARAYAEHGLDYYPKALGAVPFSPIPGQRLLAADDASRQALAQGLADAGHGLTGSHVLFVPDADRVALQGTGFLPRLGVQFHWHNAGWADFAAFLASLRQDKRKKIRQERNKVAAAGVHIVQRSGSDIREADWVFFEHCYRNTYQEHRSHPYLPLEFFLLLGQRLPEACVLFIAYRGQQPIAASLCLRDAHRLYGRYWGCVEQVDCLHFELCYYAGIDYALAQGLSVFEGGAQGEHKLARGFLPVPTWSMHRLQQPAFHQAIGRWLAQERQAMGDYLAEQYAASPYKAVDEKSACVAKNPPL